MDDAIANGGGRRVLVGGTIRRLVLPFSIAVDCNRPALRRYHRRKIRKSHRQHAVFFSAPVPASCRSRSPPSSSNCGRNSLEVDMLHHSHERHVGRKGTTFDTKWRRQACKTRPLFVILLTEYDGSQRRQAYLRRRRCVSTGADAWKLWLVVVHSLTCALSTRLLGSVLPSSPNPGCLSHH